jgi:hypothetical protein
MAGVLTKLVIVGRCAILSDGGVLGALACRTEGNTLYMHGGASASQRHSYRVPGGVRFSSILCMASAPTHSAVCDAYLASNIDIVVTGYATLLLPPIALNDLYLWTRDEARVIGTDGKTSARTARICSNDSSSISGLALTGMAAIEATQCSRVLLVASAPELIETTQHPTASLIVEQFIDAAQSDPADRLDMAWHGASDDALPMIESY